MGADTKNVILNAAEALFAERGFASTSLRHITAEAGVNLAAVNYHFGSKEALIRAVFERRIIPMNQRRMTRLDALLSAYEAQSVPLDALIEAFVRPALELATDQDKGGALFIRLLGRSYTEPSMALQQSIRAIYGPVIERFKEVFSSVLPELPADELYWRMHFMVGLLAYMMSGTDMMRLIASCQLCDTLDIEGAVKRLGVFISAGMKAPIPEVGLPQLEGTGNT